MAFPFKEIRDYYQEKTAQIYEAVPVWRWIDPYGSINWQSLFSPIEEAAWNVIRSFGKAPLYPQYPIMQYFLDFGNPATKVALECDGKQWHTDKAKDYYRDGTIFNNSEWHIYRTSGAECFAVSDKYNERDDYYEDDYLMILYDFYKTMEGVVKAIGIYYFHYTGARYMWDKELEMALRCLLNHASISQYQLIEKHLQYTYRKLLEQYFENETAIRNKYARR